MTSLNKTSILKFVNQIRSTPLQRSISSKKSDFVRIVEVGARDGLQNEKTTVPTNTKVEFIDKLSETGLKTIEVTSFVSPKWIPQLSDNTKVYSQIYKKDGVAYPVIIPNLKGLELALTVGIKEIAVMGSASESFSQKNINCSSAEAINRIKKFINVAKENNLLIRGYVSCVVGCPYEGRIQPSVVAKTAEALLDLGCYEISLGDTIGIGTPGTIKPMLKEVLKAVPASKLAIHCHDTYGQALVNIYTSLEMDLRVVDSSVSGLGGCPYARGASGNAATEDVVYELHGMGMETGVDLQKLMETGNFICKILGKTTESKVNRALFKNLS